MPDNINTICFNGLISMLEHLSEHQGIKDHESRHIYMNNAALLYTNTPLSFAIEGKTDADFPVDWAEYAGELQEHDRRIEESRMQTAVIETHYWFGSAYLLPYVSEKLPAYNDRGNILA